MNSPSLGANEEQERQAKILWILKGGGRWGLELKEIAWSARLDETGKQLFPAADALRLCLETCQQLEHQGKAQRRENFFRYIQWQNEPW